MAEAENTPVPFLDSYLVFVFLCTFGYGWFTVCGSTPLGLLSRLPRRALAVVGAIFVLLGILAERKRKI